MSNGLKRRRRRNLHSKQGGSGPVKEIKGQGRFDREVLDSDRPVLVDFWAPWCQPCKMMAPQFEAAAKELGDRAKFVKVNTEANPSLARNLKIASIPTLMLFVDGEVFDMRVGVASKAQLETMVRRALNRKEGVTTLGRIKRLFGGEATKSDSAEAGNSVGAA